MEAASPIWRRARPAATRSSFATWTPRARSPRGPTSPRARDHSDLLALPSIEESFGLVLAEAWMCGKPVIGGNIAATRCVIEHGVDGWIVDTDNPPELAERIIGLLAEPETREPFGQRGRDKVLDRYTWDKVTDVWEATFRTALAPRKGPPGTLR